MSQSNKPVRGYTGWLLNEVSRAKLLKTFPPSYERVFAHHVTLQHGTTSDNPKLPTETSGMVVGIANDDQGVEALVVSIGDTTRRWDGATYHITWSLGEGRKPVESVATIKNYGYTPISPIPIDLEPKFFPMGT